MMLECHVFILWILIWILSYQEQECCRFGPGPNCGFPCRCTGANLCDPDTGACIDGSSCQSVFPDGYGWQGPGCRIGNVAYAKTNVDQSGKYSFYSAELAVDGDTNPYVTNHIGESCANPFTSSTYAWWWVDLGDIFTVQNVSVVNRLTPPGFLNRDALFRDRSTNFDIKIGNTSDRTQQTLCFHQDKPGDDVQPIETMICDSGDMVGQYVSFTRTGGVNPNEATLCEFIVMGYQTVECHQNDCTGVCDSVTGCEQCAAGKKLPDCQEECPDGYWGVDCASTCGMCTDGVACNKVTGSCGDQCNGWYIPQLCVEKLMLPPKTSNVALSGITSDSSTLLWDRLNNVDQTTQDNFYFIVQYRGKDDYPDEWYISKRIPLSNATSFHYALSGLAHNTEFEVHIIPYREINGLTEAGSITTTTLKTLCIGPDAPTTPFIYGAPDRFTVTWKDLESISSGCDRLESAAIIITCKNTTHTLLNETYDILISTNAFTYGTTNAISCSVVLSVTNNKGFSSESAVTIATRATTTVTDSSTEVPAEPVKANGPNTAAIIVGAVAGVVIIILVIVIIALALRICRNMPPPGSGKTDIDIAGQLNPVYENTMGSDNDDIKSNINPPALVGEMNMATAKVAQSMVPSGIYENTKVPESQYASLDDTHKNTTNPSPVYQELK